MNQEKPDLKQEMDKIIERHGKTLAKYMELIGREEFEKQLEELANKKD